MLLSTKMLKFLGVKNFQATTSLDNFLKAFGCSQTKGMFPYEWLDSVDKLSLTHLPPRKEWYSWLNETLLTCAEYAAVKKIWRDEGMTSMHNYLQWVHAFEAARNASKKSWDTMLFRCILGL